MSVTMLTASKWGRLNGVSYPRAKKLFERGELEGAFVNEEGTILIPETTKLPDKPKISCRVCGKQFEQITARHLRSCSDIESLDEYRSRYPDAEIAASHVIQKIADARKGVVVSEEVREKVSKNRTGVIPTNHSRYEKGVYKHTEEAKEKMRKPRGKRS